MLDQSSRKVLVEGRVHFLGQYRVCAMGPGSDRSTALRDRDLEKGIKEQEPKSVFEVENTSANSQSTSPSCPMVEGVHPGSCKSKPISRNVVE